MREQFKEKQAFVKQGTEAQSNSMTKSTLDQDDSK